jgi:hypothetical protein
LGAANGLPVAPATGASWAVTGTFWQATQPVSAASLPLPTGAATSANQTSVQGAAGAPASTVLSVQGVPSGTNIPVSQATASALNATVVGTGTFAVQDSATETNTTTLAGAVASSVMQHNLKPVTGVTTLAGAGAVGTGAQRVAVGQDASTIAGSAPGAAGSPSVNVLTVQGVSGGTAQPVTNANPSTVYSGQQTATGSAAALPSQAFVNGVVITAKSTNGGTVYVGASGVTASTGYPLAAGQSISYAVANLSAIYILDSTSGDGVAFTGN